MATPAHRRARRRLRRWLGAFVLAVALPAALLVHTAYDQLKWESFRRAQLLAQDLAARVDARLEALARSESQRPVADYRFAPDAGGGPVSPLSRFPPDAGAIPGLIGWFEVGEDGRLSTPWLPTGATHGLGAEALAQRQAAARALEAVLLDNRLAESAPAPAPVLEDTEARAQASAR